MTRSRVECPATPPAPAMTGTGASQEEGTRMAPTAVTVSQRHGYTNSVYAGPHELTSDYATEGDIAEAGHTPWQLVLAGMGSCTAMTIEMYAQRQGWQLEGIEVHLERDDDGIIHMAVSVAGDLDEAQRERLESVSARCPVVRALSAGVDVRKTLAVHDPS